MHTCGIGIGFESLLHPATPNSAATLAAPAPKFRTADCNNLVICNSFGNLFVSNDCGTFLSDLGQIPDGPEKPPKRSGSAFFGTLQPFGQIYPLKKT
jgi:hypothetical protein